MENTGVFKNATVTAIIIIDTESSSLMFRKEEQQLTRHLDSIADQVVDFSGDRVSLSKVFMPVVDMKPDSHIIEYWQTPFVRATKHQLQALIHQLTESHSMHVLRKQMKMDEDPWDNYLYHDSRYFMPLLCHG